MNRVLALQKLPAASAEALLNSTSSVNCTSGTLDLPTVGGGGNSNCSVGCGGTTAMI